MKTLIKHPIPVIVILTWVVLAIIIGLASCTKDSQASINRKLVESFSVHQNENMKWELEDPVSEHTV